jgi:xylulokinase
VGLTKRLFYDPDNPALFRSFLYDYMTASIKDVPAGSGGVIFTPWLHGNRCPFEDPLSKGIFFNIGLETGKRYLIRAVLEGICYHKRWMLESQEKKVKTSDPIRFVGGGALSAVTSQILADILGRTIETVANPQNVGAVGAAAVVGVGLGLIPSFDNIKSFVPATNVYKPNPDNKAVYDRNFEVFKKLYKSNKENFHALNE